MIEVSYSVRFTKVLKKKIKQQKDLDKRFVEKLKLFVGNPFHPSLKTHKLTGNLEGYYSFSMGYDLRVVFYFNTDNNAVFADIGTHDEVY